MKIAIIIPALNAGGKIGKLIQRIGNTENAAKEKFSVTVVDDGSSDGTASEAAAAGANVIRHKKNMGKGESLKTGFQYSLECGFDGVITMDADGQHDPTSLPLFVEKIRQNGYDIIIGTRMAGTGRMPVLRKWTNRTTSRIVSMVSGQNIPDSQSGYRYIKAEVLKNVKLKTSKYDTESEILIMAARKGFRIGHVSVESIYQGDEKSSINPVIDTFRFIFLIIRSFFM
jgi:glycosyltransferase involved in cell wall biosynthesis